MKKPRLTKDSLPGDGWVKLAPGEFFEWHEDRPINPRVNELRQWMAWFRGVILSSSFGIENELILLALAEDFGTNDHGVVGSDYFEREQTWREDHRLDIKIDRVKPEAALPAGSQQDHPEACRISTSSQSACALPMLAGTGE